MIHLERGPARAGSRSRGPEIMNRCLNPALPAIAGLIVVASMAAIRPPEANTDANATATVANPALLEVPVDQSALNALARGEDRLTLVVKSFQPPNRGSVVRYARRRKMASIRSPRACLTARAAKSRS